MCQLLSVYHGTESSIDRTAATYTYSGKMVQKPTKIKAHSAAHVTISPLSKSGMTKNNDNVIQRVNDLIQRSATSQCESNAIYQQLRHLGRSLNRVGMMASFGDVRNAQEMRIKIHLLRSGNGIPRTNWQRMTQQVFTKSRCKVCNTNLPRPRASLHKLRHER